MGRVSRPCRNSPDDLSDGAAADAEWGDVHTKVDLVVEHCQCFVGNESLYLQQAVLSGLKRRELLHSVVEAEHATNMLVVRFALRLL